MRVARWRRLSQALSAALFILPPLVRTGGKARITLADQDGRELAAVHVTVPETASQP